MNNQPTRFCIVSEEEFKHMTMVSKLYSWNDINTSKPAGKKHCCDLKLVTGVDGQTPFLYGLTNLPNVMLPGVCVSMWRNSAHMNYVSMEFTTAIEKSFGRGFGDRSCAPCLGVNGYFGHHCSKRVISRPETKPGTRVMDHYGRQTDKFQENVPLCQKFIYSQARAVLQITRTMNDNYMQFIGYDTCNRIIWTQGINHINKQENLNGHANQRCIGFANKLHIDKCDLIKKEISDQWFKWLEEKIKETCLGKNNMMQPDM